MQQTHTVKKNKPNEEVDPNWLNMIENKVVDHGFQRMVVSAIMEVTTYGSMLDAGLLSSKYPFPSFSVSLPTLTDAPRFATPCNLHSQ